MKGAMPSTYRIESREGRWVISANGAALLTCARKTTAEHIANKASESLSVDPDLKDATDLDQYNRPLGYVLVPAIFVGAATWAAIGWMLWRALH
jgi:hypothetical protein